MRIEELRENRNDNARRFVDFPEVIFFDEMADHLARLHGSEISEFEADGVFGVWIEFEYRDNKFFVDTKLGDYRFWVEDPECDENILIEIADHLRMLLEKPEGSGDGALEH